jgi:hypothetical protein
MGAEKNHTVLSSAAGPVEGADPMSFFPLPDPSATQFTLEQVWPDASGKKTALESAPAWMRAMMQPAKD